MKVSIKEYGKFTVNVRSMCCDSSLGKSASALDLLYFESEKLSLYNADSTTSSLFSSPFADLVITSPPYNVGIEYNSHNDEMSYVQYLAFCEKWMSNCYLWSKDEGRFCLNIPLDKNKGGAKSVGADLTRIAQDVGWKYKSSIIWNEGNISRRTAWGSWMSASAPVVIAPVELIVVFYKNEWKKTKGSLISDISDTQFKEWTCGIWSFNGESKKKIGHPAPFPKELPYRCIKLFSYVGDVVLDPFAGSGTTLIVAKNTNRFAVGIEIDKNYCQLAKERIIEEAEGFKFDE